MATVLVGGVIANKCHNGGATWTRLSWLVGLKRLGFDVHFVEQIRGADCVDASGVITRFDESVNRAYFRQTLEQFDLVGMGTLLCDDGAQSEGLRPAELLDLADDAVALVNISGHVRWEPLLRRVRRKIYVDLDPGYTQFWHEAALLGDHLLGHDRHFTIGENVGADNCPIPTGGITWRTTRQPVVLEHWPLVAGQRSDCFTTVASWRGPFGAIEHAGKRYGLKAHEFRRFIELPRRVAATFEIALEIDPADARDRAALEKHGWQIVNPRTVVPGPLSFRSFVQRSGAELSVAQGIYVETYSGWFSDRTVRYLASGRPAVVQDTGFSRRYPVGEGLIAFRTLNEAIAGAERVMADWEQHSRAARAIAEAHFDSDKVLVQFVDEAGITP